MNNTLRYDNNNDSSIGRASMKKLESVIGAQ